MRVTGFLAPLEEGPGRPHGLLNLRTGKFVARRLEAAFDSGDRRKGLLGRSSLDPGTEAVVEEAMERLKSPTRYFAPPTPR